IESVNLLFSVSVCTPGIPIYVRIEQKYFNHFGVIKQCSEVYVIKLYFIFSVRNIQNKHFG
ncbi:unnamed protein product, partial [Larinioides sclopetarius]